MSLPATITSSLQSAQHSWLITGVSGFIGSHLLQALLLNGQRVRGLDNSSSGFSANLDKVKEAVGDECWSGFEWVDGDIRDADACARACAGVDIVLHQAAMVSVPRSLEDPALAHEVNVDGTWNLLSAARDAGAKRFVYASSCAVYGDLDTFPLSVHKIGNFLSPYAATKYINEIQAATFSKCFGLDCVGLRYFNVFGPRQDPMGAYAAVIAKWIDALLRGEPAIIYGDGKTTRDFCFVANVVQANLLAALTGRPEALNRVYNVGCGRQTSLNELHQMILQQLSIQHPQLKLKGRVPEYRDGRPGDIRHSFADIRETEQILGYAPMHQVEEGLRAMIEAGG